ncbi:MAG: cupredoxin domain-containing protein [Candidatus Aenigmatarchaeota archaeon]
MESKHVITIVGLFVIVSVFVFTANAIMSGSDRVSTGYAVVSSQAVSEGGAGKQVVQLSMKNGNYYPQDIRVKKGVPVEINVDLNSVRGCYKAIKIPAFGVEKIVSASDNKIQFTPDKAGTFGFSCYMGMGTGQLIVEDETGSVPELNTVSQDVQGGSCSSSGGGCGCGG